jgi:hypothetical protein
MGSSPLWAARRSSWGAREPNACQTVIRAGFFTTLSACAVARGYIGTCHAGHTLRSRSRLHAWPWRGRAGCRGILARPTRQRPASASYGPQTQRERGRSTWVDSEHPRHAARCYPAQDHARRSPLASPVCDGASRSACRQLSRTFPANIQPPRRARPHTGGGNAPNPRPARALRGFRASGGAGGPLSLPARRATQTPRQA